MNGQQWLLLQLADSAFPAGGFAHSGGLEVAHQAGVVRDAGTLGEFIDCQLAAAARAVAPFALRVASSPDAWRDVDEECDVFLTNHLANRASRTQGRALLSAAARIYAAGGLVAAYEALRAQKAFGHFAPALGRVAASLDVGRGPACGLLMFLTVRAAVSSAVRLGIVGPIEGQSIQHAAAAGAARWAKAAAAAADGPPVQVAPLLDFCQAGHDRLYSRLFQS